jgi:colanic acid biosynthesis glycosyl transferase WcaI
MNQPSISVLIINRVFPPDQGATGRLLAELAVRLVRDHGCRVTIVCDGDTPVGTQPAGLTVVRTGRGLPVDGPAGLRSYLAVWGRLIVQALRLIRRDGRYDVLITMTDPPLLAWLGLLLRPLLARRLIHWCQDLYPDLLPLVGLHLPEPAQRLLQQVNGVVLRLHDAVIAIDPAMSQRFLALGVDPDRVNLLPNWAPEIFAEPTGSPSPVWSNLDDPAGLIVLYAGTLGLAHPVDLLLQAARLLQDSHPTVRFVVAGSGRNRPALQAGITRLGLSNILTLPWLPMASFAALCRRADLHLALMDSRAVGAALPCKLTHAAAAGRPALLAGVPSDLADDAQLTPPRSLLRLADAVSLARAIGRCVDDAAFLAAAGDCARAEQQALEAGGPLAERMAGRFAALLTPAHDPLRTARREVSLG